MALQALWQRELRHMPDEELQTEREYCARELAYADAGDVMGHGTIPAECWREIYGERIAWIDAEVGKRQRIAGLYRKADTGFTGEYVEHVKRAVDLADFITERHPDTRLKWYGGHSGLLGFCPWHRDEHHKSLGVWPKPEWHWFCWACLEGGDVFNWLLKQDATGFRDAVRIAAAHTGIAPPESKLGGVAIP